MQRWLKVAPLSLWLGLPASAQAPPVPSILDVASPKAAEVSTLFWWVIGLSVLVMLAVTAFLGAIIWRGLKDRHRAEEPPQTHDNVALEALWTVVPLLIVGVLFALTAVSTFRLHGLAAPPDALHIRVVGWQFWWEMRYTAEVIVTANELVVPVGRPVRLELTSGDVIHSFWIPQLAGKTDMIPGQVRYLWFTAKRPGIFHGQCAELCGDSHARMLLRAIVLPPEDFAAWVAAAQQAPAAPVDALAHQGSQLFVQRGCITCHTVLDRRTAVRPGPDLSHIGSRTSIAAGVLPNNREAMVRWLMHPELVKPGNLMPNLGLGQAEAEALAAYLETLALPGFDLRAAIDAALDGSPSNQADTPANNNNTITNELALERP